MKLLVRDSFSNAMSSFEVNMVFERNTIPVRDYNTNEIIEAFKFPAVAQFNVSGSDSFVIYIASNNTEEIEQLIIRITEDGFLDATSYCESTFISPDVREFDNIGKLSDQLNSR